MTVQNVKFKDAVRIRTRDAHQINMGVAADTAIVESMEVGGPGVRVTMKAEGAGAILVPWSNVAWCQLAEGQELAAPKTAKGVAK